MKAVNLKAMSFDALMALREDLDRVIAERTEAERKDLETRLARLDRVTGRAARKGRGSALKGRKVAAKYRNPENPAESWSGRGGTPRWLQALIKQGKKKEDFLIEGAARKPAAKTARKGRGRKKAA